MSEQWRMTPPILPIQLHYPSQQNRASNQMDTMNNKLNEGILENERKKHRDKKQKELKGAFKKKSKCQIQPSLLSKAKDTKKKQANKNDQQKIQIQVKKIQKFMKKLNDVSNEVKVRTKQLEPHSKSKEKKSYSHSKNMKSLIEPNTSRTEKTIKVKKGLGHRRGHSDIVGRGNDEKKQKFLMNKCISGVTSLASLDYPKVPSKELQMNNDLYCLTEQLPRVFRLEEPDELALKVSIDAIQMKEFLTTNHSQKDEEQENLIVTERSTKNIIQRYIDLLEQKKDSSAEGKSEESLCSNLKQLLEVRILEDGFSPIPLQKGRKQRKQMKYEIEELLLLEKNQRNQSEQIWKQILLSKIQKMMGQVRQISEEQQKSSSLNEIRQQKAGINLNLSIDNSSKESFEVPSSLGTPTNNSFNPLRKQEDKWVGNLTKETEVSNLDKFLKDRMMQLISEQCFDVQAQSISDIEDNNLEKWVKFQFQSLRKARSLISKGIKQASSILQDNHPLRTQKRKKHLSNWSSLTNLTRKLKKSKQKSIKNENKDKDKDKDKETEKTTKIFKSKDKKPSAFPLPQDNPISTPQYSDVSSLCPWMEERKQFEQAESEFYGRNSSKGSIIEKGLFKNLSKEGVEELLELLFLQMILEVIDEVEDRGNFGLCSVFNDLRTIFHLEKKKPEIQIEKKDDEALRRKGFGTTPKDVTNFLIFFIKNLLREDKVDVVRDHITKNISQPIGPGPLELLKYMRGSEDVDLGESEEEEEEEKISFVFNIKWFEEYSLLFINHHDFGTFFTDPTNEMRRQDFLRSAMHIHNKAIFDSLNEIIDRERPFGLFGQPYPWKVKISNPSFDEKGIEKILKKVCENVSLASRFLCGLINDPNSPYQLSQYELYDIREDRMCKYLCTEIEETEERWKFFDDEETELMVTVSNNIYYEEILVAVKEIYDILLVEQYPPQFEEEAEE